MSRIYSEQTQKKEEHFWVLKDFHLNIETKSILRGIRDLKDKERSANKVYNPIIVVSPIVNIPTELEKTFTIMDYDLPDKEEIKLYFDSYIRNMEKQKDKFTIPTEEEINNCIDLAQGLTINEVIKYLSESLIEYRTISKKIFFKARLDLLKKTSILEYKDVCASLDDMGGNEPFKEWITEIKECFTKEAKEFGVIRPKGFLAVGSPGTSKSLSAEIVASELNLPLLQFKMSKIMDSKVGQSEKNMENALNLIKVCSPCVLFIDEVEKALSGTASSDSTDGGTLMRVVGQLLTFLGSDESKDIFTIMTSNNASALPPELTRSGRIDAIWYFSLPSSEERREIFKIHFAKSNKKVDDGLIAYAANHTEHYTGAEIKEIVKVAVRKAYLRYKKDNNPSITTEDIDLAIPEIVSVYNSSKEKISAIEEYYRGRARWANTIIKNDPEKSEQDIIEFDLNV